MHKHLLGASSTGSRKDGLRTTSGALNSEDAHIWNCKIPLHPPSGFFSIICLYVPGGAGFFEFKVYVHAGQVKDFLLLLVYYS